MVGGQVRGGEEARRPPRSTPRGGYLLARPLGNAPKCATIEWYAFCTFGCAVICGKDHPYLPVCACFLSFSSGMVFLSDDDGRRSGCPSSDSRDAPPPHRVNSTRGARRWAAGHIAPPGAEDAPCRQATRGTCQQRRFPPASSRPGGAGPRRREAPTAPPVHPWRTRGGFRGTALPHPIRPSARPLLAAFRGASTDDNNRRHACTHPQVFDRRGHEPCPDGRLIPTGHHPRATRGLFPFR